MTFGMWLTLGIIPVSIILLAIILYVSVDKGEGEQT